MVSYNTCRLLCQIIGKLQETILIIVNVTYNICLPQCVISPLRMYVCIYVCMYVCKYVIHYAVQIKFNRVLLMKGYVAILICIQKYFGL
jgi:hypothetical protein